MVQGRVLGRTLILVPPISFSVPLTLPTKSNKKPQSTFSVETLVCDWEKICSNIGELFMNYDGCQGFQDLDKGRL